MNKIIFNADRTTITEGEVVQLSWQCSGAERVELCIDNGYRATTLPLEAEGTKRFRLNRSKGRTRLTLTAWDMDSHRSATIKVRVQPIPTARAEAVDGRGRRLGRVGEWWHQRVLPKWQLLRGRYFAAWRELPPAKRLASRLVLLLAVLLLLSVVTPWLFSLGIVALMAYLLWFVYKR